MTLAPYYSRSKGLLSWFLYVEKCSITISKFCFVLFRKVNFKLRGSPTFRCYVSYISIWSEHCCVLLNTNITIYLFIFIFSYITYNLSTIHIR